MGDGKILCGGVGSGKSLTSAVYYKRNHWPKDLYVITTAKKRDSLEWLKEINLIGLSTHERHPEGPIAKVDSWNNISKYVDIENAFFIFDEQRLIGSGAWVKSFYKIAKKNSWILLSATPGDTWSDYIPVFVANGFYKNKTQFEREHAVFSRYAKFPKIERYIGEKKLNALRYKILVPMPFARHTKQHTYNLPVDYNKEDYKRVWVKRWNIYEDRPIREVGELYHTIRKVVNSSYERVSRTREILRKHGKAIVFYNFDYELEALRTLSDEFTVREWNGHKHEPVPEGDNWVYLVQYLAGNEAWNCITTDTMVFYSLNYSWRIIEQCKGRIDRLNTPYTDLHYYFLVSSSPIDGSILKSIDRRRVFNESAHFKSAYGKGFEEVKKGSEGPKTT